MTLFFVVRKKGCGPVFAVAHDIFLVATDVLLDHGANRNPTKHSSQKNTEKTVEPKTKKVKTPRMKSPRDRSDSTGSEKRRCAFILFRATQGLEVADYYLVIRRENLSKATKKPAVRGAWRS